MNHTISEFSEFSECRKREVTKPDSIADSMNKYFCSMGEQLSKEIPNKTNSFISDIVLNVKTNFSFSPLIPEQLIKTMSKFKTSNGFGVNNISSFFLKKGMLILGNSSSLVFNLCMSLGRYPDS